MARRISTSDMVFDIIKIIIIVLVGVFVIGTLWSVLF